MQEVVGRGASRNRLRIEESLGSPGTELRLTTFSESLQGTESRMYMPIRQVYKLRGSRSRISYSAQTHTALHCRGLLAIFIAGSRAELL